MSDTRFRNMLMRGLGLIAVLALFAVPVIGTRAMVQDLFGVLTLLVLALNWNLLAGFAGLVSVGQQAFVGLGAYTMFACVILLGIDPLWGILAGGIVAMVVAVPVAFFTFRLSGAYFAIATWVVAEIVRLVLAQGGRRVGGAAAGQEGATCCRRWFEDCSASRV